MATAATISVLLNLDAKNFNKGLSRALRDSRTFGNQMKSLGSSFNGIVDTASSAFTNAGSAITKYVTLPAVAAGVAVIALGADALQVGADFEKAMSGLGAILGSDTQMMKALKDEAIRLGLNPNLIVTASQAVAVMERLAKNGLTSDQILAGAAESAIALANATGTDMAVAADTAAVAMQLFNLNGEEMAGIVDNITGLVTNSRFTVEDFAQALAMGGGVSDMLGVPIDDFTTLVTKLSEVTSGGSDAGTSIKTFLLRLVPRTKPAIEMMTKLGLVTEEGGNQFFDAAGKMKPLEQVAGLLSNAFKDLSQEERLMATNVIFGTDAIRAATVMTELGSEGFRDLGDSLAGTDAAKNAATRMDNLSGAIEIAGGIIEAFKIKFFDAFGPGVRKVVEAFSTFMSLHSEDIQRMFSLLAVHWDKAMTWLSTAIAENGPKVFDFIFKLIDSIPTVIQNIKDLGVKAEPYIKQFFDAITNVDSDTVAQVVSGILGLAALGPVLLAIGAALPTVVPLLMGLMSGVKLDGPAMVLFFQNLVAELPAFIQHLKDIGTEIGPSLQKVFDAFMNMDPATISTIIEVIGALVLLGPPMVILGSTVNVVTTAFGLLKTLLFPFIGWIFATAIPAVVAFALANMAWLLPLFLVGAAVGLLYAAFKTNFGGITTTVKQLWFIIKWAFTNVMSKIHATIGKVGDLAKKFLTIKLPDFLTPGSPTPFEYGLIGIKDAMQKVNDESSRLASTLTPGAFGMGGNIDMQLSKSASTPGSGVTPGGDARGSDNSNRAVQPQSMVINIENPKRETSEESIRSLLRNLNYTGQPN